MFQHILLIILAIILGSFFGWLISRRLMLLAGYFTILIAILWIVSHPRKATRNMQDMCDALTEGTQGMIDAFQGEKEGEE